MDKNDILKRQQANPFESISKSIHAVMRAEIITMKLLPEAKINISQLAEQLGTSRTPVQAATQQLECEGLLQTTDNGRSLIVAPVDIDKFKKLSEVRLAIEGNAAFWAAKRITSGELEYIESLCTKYADIVHGDCFHKQATIDQSFHVAVVKAAKNSLLLSMHQSIQGLLLRYRYYLNTLPNPAYVQQTLQEASNTHWGLFNALKMHLSIVAQAQAEQDANNMLGTVHSFKQCH